jgi:hypothetical protein
MANNHWEKVGNLMERIGDTKFKRPFPRKSKRLALFDVCWLTSLVAKNFYAYLYFLPFMTWVNGKGTNCGSQYKAEKGKYKYML